MAEYFADCDEPIWKAACNGHWHTVRQCLEREPSLISVTHRVADQNHPWEPLFTKAYLIHLAAMWTSDTELLEFLLSKGADVNAKGANAYTNEFEEYSDTPLHLATMYAKNVKVVQFLLSKGADVNTKDISGNTPLHLSAYCQNADIAKLLVAHGAVIDETNAMLATPLHYAAKELNVDVIGYLISQGAYICAQDCNGETPQDYAKYPISKVARDLCMSSYIDSKVFS